MSETKSNTPAPRAGTAFSLLPLRQQMDRLFSEITRGFPTSVMFGNDGQNGFWPSAELVENDHKATIRVELPGIEPKDVEISASENEITISGEKKTESSTKDGDRVTTERSYGAFSRVFSLGFPIDASKVDAKYEQGVLTLSIDKPAEAKPATKKIEIH